MIKHNLDLEAISQEPVPDNQPKKASLMAVFTAGIWRNNPGLCQLLGLCPLLAVSSTATNALGLGIATIIVAVLASTLVSLMRHFILREVRIPLYIVLIAALVTIIQFYVQAYYPDLYEQLGIYLALITSNCIIMGRAEAFAGKNNPLKACLDALGMGIGFCLVLVLLGAARELIGTGSLFQGAHLLLGSWASVLEVQLYDNSYTFLIAILPPGGFFVLAFFIAYINARAMHKRNKEENRFKIKSRLK